MWLQHPSHVSRNRGMSLDRLWVVCMINWPQPRYSKITAEVLQQS